MGTISVPLAARPTWPSIVTLDPPCSTPVACPRDLFPSGPQRHITAASAATHTGDEIRGGRGGICDAGCGHERSRSRSMVRRYRDGARHTHRRRERHRQSLACRLGGRLGLALAAAVTPAGERQRWRRRRMLGESGIHRGLFSRAYSYYLPTYSSQSSYSGSRSSSSKQQHSYTVPKKTDSPGAAAATPRQLLLRAPDTS